MKFSLSGFLGLRLLKVDIKIDLKLAKNKKHLPYNSSSLLDSRSVYLFSLLNLLIFIAKASRHMIGVLLF